MRKNVPALAAVISILGALACAPAGALAQGVPAATPPNSILTVSGEGIVTRSPDRATISLEIVTNNDSAQTATSQNNTVYAGLRTRLAPLGITADAIHTTSFGMNFVPKPVADGNGYHPARTGYVVTRGLSITVDQLDSVGRTIDAAVAAGVTDLGGVSYGLRDRRSAYASALAAAMQDAQAQASALADAAHLRLGTVRSINAGGSAVPQPGPVFRSMAASAASVPTDIQPSGVDVRATVGVTYYLLR